MKKILSLLLVSCAHLCVNAQSGWSSVGSGLTLPVTTMATDSANQLLYAGGIYTGTGTLPAIGIAKWNGTRWSQIGGLLSGLRVSSMLVKDGELIVGGTFSAIGGLPTTNIAKWTGTAWTTLGSGLNQSGTASVDALATYNGEIYAGGTFTTSGSAAVSYIAKWDGSSWQPVGSGTNGAVKALCVFNGELYAGGTFTSAGSTFVHNIAKWDGTIWSDVGGGVDYTGATTVSTMKNFGDALYIGGTFTSAGGTAVHHIAKWNGVLWSDVGGGVDYTGATTVSTMLWVNDVLWAGGTFTSAGGVSANYVATWNGISWSPVGSGMNSSVTALEKLGNTVYAGGDFLFAGEKLIPFIAKYSPSVRSLETADETAQNQDERWTLYPNPASTVLNIKFNTRVNDEVYSFALVDALGRLVLKQEITGSAATLNINNIAPGMYYYQIHNAQGQIEKNGKINIE